MVLQHTVLATEMTFAEIAVTDDTLGDFSAVIKSAAYLLRWHGVAFEQSVKARRSFSNVAEGLTEESYTRLNQAETKLKWSD